MNGDLELYRIFCEVAKNKNISKTAEKMFISQSAITQSIQKLEKLLGGKVFYRNKYGVELTEEGKKLYEYVKDSISTINNAEAIFSQYNNLQKGRIRIGGGTATAESVVLQPLLQYIKEYPTIDIYMTNGHTDYLMNKLANGELEMVAINLPYDKNKYANIEIIPCKDVKYCFFASKKYLEKNPCKTPDEIINHPLILPKRTTSKGRILDKYLNQKDVSLHGNYEISSSDMLIEFVLDEAGIGFAKMTTLEQVKDKIEIIKIIEDKELEETQEGIAVLKSNMQNKATTELIKFIKKYHNK